MTAFKYLILSLSFIAMSCTSNRKATAQNIAYALTADQKALLITETKNMLALDQQYRDILLLGTMDPETVKRNAELSEKASLEEYMAFLKSVKKDISKQQSDSLWKLQHQSDYTNYIKLKSIIARYGYPSSQRLGIKDDYAYVILLHPPIQINPKDYLNEMQAILLKEVIAKRMEAKQYAVFVDDIKAKILHEPQLYGTINSFDMVTMKPGLPIIENLSYTNEKRKEIGLSELKEGEYILSR